MSKASASAIESLKNWFQASAAMLIDDQEKVTVEALEIGARVHFQICSTSPGPIIGKGGSTISNLRQVAEKIATRQRFHILVDVDEITQ